MTIADGIINDINSSPKARVFAEIAEDDLLILAIDVAHYIKEGRLPVETLRKLSKLKDSDITGVYTLAAELVVGDEDGA